MIHKNRGFTLIELCVVMALTGLVTVGVYRTFTWQQRVHATQETVAALQQDVRGGLDLMVRDLRMAGFSPKIAGVAGIIAAADNSLSFTLDEDSSGSIAAAGETVTYSLVGSTLTRVVLGSAPQEVIENVNVLNFVYLDANGNVIATPVASAEDRAKIRSIQITVVAGVPAAKGDKAYSNTTAYRNQPPPTASPGTLGTVIYTAPGDGLRRRVLSATVNCRNMGG